jgi:hypothetical protein
MRGNGLGQRCSPYRKTCHYKDANTFDIEKLIHFERGNLTGIVLVRVPLSSRTFAFKVESYRRISWTSPNSMPPPIFPSRGCVPFTVPNLTVRCLHPAAATELIGCNRSVGQNGCGVPFDRDDDSVHGAFSLSDVYCVFLCSPDIEYSRKYSIFSCYIYVVSG